VNGYNEEVAEKRQRAAEAAEQQRRMEEAGAAILVSCDVKVSQAAPAAWLHRL
jgi:hypothetical protein